MQSVVICEKPSQAKNVREAVGNKYGKILAARGHLFRLAMPEEVNSEWKQWGFEVLRPEGGFYPFVADNSSGKKEVIQNFRKAFKGADTVIIATDCDREGQAIGENIVRHCEFKGDVFRVIFSAEDPKTLCEAFANKRPNAEYKNLYQAAFARVQADQIVNLSMTRAATLALKPPSMRGALGIGRVKTPTMGIVCRREKEIAAFKPRDYFDLFLDVTEGTETLRLKWNAPEDERFYDKAQASAIVEPLARWEGLVSVKTKRKTAAPPKPMDLPALQQHAARWGWTAKKTLDTAQALYETHKITTYPRAETRYLPEVEIDNAGAMLEALQMLPDWPAAGIGWEGPTIRKGKAGTFSDAGLAGASHHAVVPNVNTRLEWGAIYPKLADDERKLFDAIARSYLAAIGPDWIYDRTEISVQPEDRKFAAVGVVNVELGWREAMGGELSDNEAVLPLWDDGSTVTVTEAGTEKKTTKPPARYTEGSLIKAMQEAWRFAEDPAQSSRLKEAKGIGTPATRDTVIEGLKKQGLIEVEKKTLKASELGTAVYEILQAEAPEILDPAVTAEMELALDEILSAKSQTDQVVSALVDRAVDFNEKMKSRGSRKIDVKVTTKGGPSGPEPSKAAVSFAKKIAKAAGCTIPKETMKDRGLLSSWIDQHKTQLPDEPSPKQVDYAKSISDRKKIEIPPEALRSRSALSAWIGENG